MEVDELDDESQVDEDDPKLPQTMIMNLDIAGKDIFDDETNLNASRIAASTVITQQVAFYVACALRGFYNRLVPAAPLILIYGGGLIGQRVVDSLVSMKCGEMLYIYTRGDLRAKYWRSKGLKSSPSMTRLLKGNKVDVVVLLAGMSSFQNMTKLLIPNMTRSTCVINAAYGLERRRFFALLRTPTVFRTYVEPQYLIELIGENPVLQEMLKEGQLGQGVTAGRKDSMANFDLSAIPGKLPKHENNVDDEVEGGGGEGNGESKKDKERGLILPEDSIIDESVVASIEQEESQRQSTILDSILTFNVEQSPAFEDTEEGTIEYAADLIAQRSREIKDLVYQWENYYALIGVKHRQARAQALQAVLGYDPDDFAPSRSGVEGNHEYGGVGMGAMADGGLEGMGGSMVSSLADNDNNNIGANAGGGGTVLEEMLKTIKVSSYETLVSAMETLEGLISVHFRRQFSKYIRLVDIPDINAFHEGAGGSQHGHKKLRKRRPKKDEGAGNQAVKDGQGELRDDGANDEDEEERDKARDSEGVPIHSDARIKRILAYDCKLSGRAKEKAGAASLLDEFSASLLSGIEDDLSSVASSIEGIPLGSHSLDAEDEQKMGDDGDDSKSSLRDRILSELPSRPSAGAVSREVPVMLANPIQAEDTEMKLLKLLESNARQKRKEEQEKEMAALA